jgi:hypothetical protein
VRRARNTDPARGAFDDPAWNLTSPVPIANYHARSSDHRPRSEVRLIYDAENLYIRYDVSDRYVVSKQTQPQASVCLDSCVEFFFAPAGKTGYFNLEINCGGTPLFHYVEDNRRTEQGFEKCAAVSAQHLSCLLIYHSMPKVVDPEIIEPTAWRVGCKLPLSVLENYVGPLGDLAAQSWRGNFYKCADRCSHPHWASWSPIGKNLDFHQPDRFAAIYFEDA